MASLPTLPVEILHQIFSELDPITVFLSVRKVCRQLRQVTKTHYRYELDLRSISKPDFHRLVTVIHPDYVTSLALSDGEMTPGQIGLFLSLVDIDRFTRLRSLTLIEIKEQNLCVFLQHARRCVLSRLTICTSLANRPEKALLEHFSAVISQPTLLHLELSNVEAIDLLDGVEWPVQCQLRHLTLEKCCRKQVLKILQCTSELETLEIYGPYSIILPEGFQEELILVTPHQKLTSLRLINAHWSMDFVRSLLTKTPCLTHLQIAGDDIALSPGHVWENLIKATVPLLTKFELNAYFPIFLNSTHNDLAKWKRLIASFWTPSWIEEKHWFFISKCFVNRQAVEISTSPTCGRNIPLVFDENTKTLSNFDREFRPLTMSDSSYQSSDKLVTGSLFQSKVS